MYVTVLLVFGLLYPTESSGSGSHQISGAMLDQMLPWNFLFCKQVFHWSNPSE